MDGWPKSSTEGKTSDKAAVLSEIKIQYPVAAEPDAENLARNNFTPKKSDKDSKGLLVDVSCNKSPNESPGKRELFKNNFTQQESVSDLSESGLKALLEEAVSYKTPSDVHGKSELFKVLLQSIETDNDYASRGERQEKTSRKLKRRLRKDVDPKCGSLGSLQDLADRSGEVKGKEGPSSAPFVSKHGPYDNDDENRLNSDHNILHNGNLESVQDFQHYFCGEGKTAELSDSTITIPLSYIRGSLTQNGVDDSDVERTCINEALKAVRCLEPALDNKDDSLTSKESIYHTEKRVDENGNALNSSSTERKGKCRRLKAKNDKNTIMSHHIEGHRSDIAQDIDALMQYIESPTKNDDIKSSSSRQQRSHTQRIAGSGSAGGCKLRTHRDKSSDTVRKGQRKNKDNKFKKSTSLEELSISKFEDLTSEATEERSVAYRRREGELATEPIRAVDVEKKRVESMVCKELKEVVSLPPKRPSGSLHGASPQRKEAMDTTDSLDAMEFHTVTKKQRKKKYKISSGQNKFRNKAHNFQVNSVKQDRNFYPYESKQRNLFRRNDIWQRRKSTSSVPSSDKSGESCDDLDSVHSLPISTSSVRAMCNDINKGSSTTVSYAAIARSAPSPLKQSTSEGHNSDAPDKPSSWSSSEDAPLPDLIPSVMLPLPSKKEKPRVVPVVNNPEEYPPLSSDARDDSSRDMFVEYTVIVPKKEKCTYSSSNNINIQHQESASVEKTVVVRMPPTKNPSPVSQVEQNVQHTVKRPAVILMSENKESSAVQDLEFGFEINQQLLSSSMNNGMEENSTPDDCEEEEEEWASSINDNAAAESQDVEEIASTSKSKTESVQPPKEISPLVAFINSEWELVMKELALDRESRTGKVVYYSAESH